MAAIFTDENKTCKIDFSCAVWATDQLNKIFNDSLKDGVLFNVDFIAEYRNSIFFIEVKNSNFYGVDKPKIFNPLDSQKLREVAHKYFDSFHYVRGLNKTNNKQKIYIYLIETYNGDIALRTALRSRLKDLLPFKLQESFSERMIDEVLVFSFDEWCKKFPQFPLSRLQPQLTQN